MKERENWMHFAFNFPLEKKFFWNNIIKYDKSWSFLLIIWDEENRFFAYNLRRKKYLKKSLAVRYQIILIFFSFGSG